MVRKLLPLVAVLACGCVPVTEPVGDITKAEPDKNLVGTWAGTDGKAVLKIDVPVVKGNPKGLMRWTFTDSKNEEALWFFVAAVGKEKYGNLCLTTDDNKDKMLDFSKEGTYEKWTKAKTRAYVVFHYTTGKDQISLNFGDEKAFKAVATEAKLTKVDSSEVYITPAGWLEKYFDKNGREKVFPNGDAKTFTRSK